MIKYIKAKKLLSHVKDDTWFGMSYNLNLYRGCQHQCIYCDSRSKCYQIENFNNIEVKENAIELLDQELKSKRKKGTIGFGSMNDCYMPVEKKLRLTREALTLVYKHGFPVHIITKGTLVTRDIDLLKAIGKTYSAVSFSLSTVDDKLARLIEPGAPLPSERLNAVKQLSESGIYTGITLMPVLPHITDTEENIRNIIIKAAEAGAKYIIASFGVTLRDVQKEYFIQKLAEKFPHLINTYKNISLNKYFVPATNYEKLYLLYNTLLQEYELSAKPDFYEEPKEQFSLF